MTSIAMYLTQLILTLAACFLLTAYLRPALRQVLTDLCKTEPRAQFWTVFSNILLIILPVVFGMGYQPVAGQGLAIFFDVAGQLRWNLLGYIAALITIGVVVSFFALVALRSQEYKERIPG
jgi:MFS family permease